MINLFRHIAPRNFGAFLGCRTIGRRHDFDMWGEKNLIFMHDKEISTSKLKLANMIVVNCGYIFSMKCQVVSYNLNYTIG